MGDSFTAAPFVPLTDVAHGCHRSSNNYPTCSPPRCTSTTCRTARAAAPRPTDLPGEPGHRARDVGAAPVRRAVEATPTWSRWASARTTSTSTPGWRPSAGARQRHLPALRPARDASAGSSTELRPALVSTLEQVKELAPNARVLLVGYPKLLPPRGDCARLPRMRPQDRATFREINLRLRHEMRRGRRGGGGGVRRLLRRVRTATTSAARHPWVQGRIGSRRLGAALHPLPAGQAALARLIEQTLREEPELDVT